MSRDDKEMVIPIEPGHVPMINCKCVLSPSIQDTPQMREKLQAAGVGRMRLSSEMCLQLQRKGIRFKGEEDMAQTKTDQYRMAFSDEVSAGILMETLGINVKRDRVRRVEIVFEAREAVIVRVERYIGEDSADALLRELATNGGTLAPKTTGRKPQWEIDAENV